MSNSRDVFQTSQCKVAQYKHSYQDCDGEYHNIKKFLKTYINPSLYDWCYQLLERDADVMFDTMDSEDGINTWIYAGDILMEISERNLPDTVSGTIEISDSLKSKAVLSYKKDKYKTNESNMPNSLQNIIIEHIRDNYDLYKSKLNMLPSDLCQKVLLCECEMFDSKHFDFILKDKYSGNAERFISTDKDESKDVEYSRDLLDVYELDDDNLYYVETSQNILIKKIDGTYYAKFIVSNEREIKPLTEEEIQFCHENGLKLGDSDDDLEIIRKVIEDHYKNK